MLRLCDTPLSLRPFTLRKKIMQTGARSRFLIDRKHAYRMSPRSCIMLRLRGLLIPNFEGPKACAICSRIILHLRPPHANIAPCGRSAGEGPSPLQTSLKNSGGPGAPFWGRRPLLGTGLKDAARGPTNPPTNQPGVDPLHETARASSLCTSTPSPPLRAVLAPLFVVDRSSKLGSTASARRV